MYDYFTLVIVIFRDCVKTPLDNLKVKWYNKQRKKVGNFCRNLVIEVLVTFTKHPAKRYYEPLLKLIQNLKISKQTKEFLLLQLIG